MKMVLNTKFIVFQLFKALVLCQKLLIDIKEKEGERERRERERERERGREREMEGAIV